MQTAAAHANMYRPASFGMQAGDWVYRGEGNANILFAYAGEGSELRGQLLRLTKRDVPQNTDINADDSDTDDSSLNKEQEQLSLQAHNNVVFTKEVIGPLIGVDYILQHQLVHLSSNFIEQLSLAAEPLRPSSRTHKQIDLRQRVGALVRDMINVLGFTPKQPGEHTIAIEIKPKWGFVPSSKYISQANSVKHRVCRHCMHQYLKHDKDSMSEYCPIDLFSTNCTQVKHAVDCLFDVSNDRLRVFVDGTHIPADENGGIDVAKVPHSQQLKQTIANIILAEKLLPRLGSVQNRLDAFDIEGLFPRYKRALEAGVLTEKEPSIDDWLEAVARFRQREEQGGSNVNSPDVDDKQAALEFMISVTLKDVSVLIRIESWPSASKSESESAEGDSSNTKLPEYHIAVIDADAKKLAKVPKYLKNDQEIVDRYLEINPNVAQQKACCEQQGEKDI
ncbi:hypothetical protein GGF37_000131 [Kickxella alabastrina]|nr:hypothetical protein GGF37_000131 [Kickxella alabastrina]